MLLSLVFLPFNVYLSVDLSILPLLFLSWHFLFKSHESLTMVCKKEACTLVCIQGPESASSAQSWVNTIFCHSLCLLLSTWNFAHAGAPAMTASATSYGAIWQEGLPLDRQASVHNFSSTCLTFNLYAC